jgi:CubicO group peptidase (beta-lactamase class C family)
MQKLLVYLTLIILCFTHCTNQKQRKADQIDVLVKKGYQLGLFNGTVLVAYNGEVIYKSAHGYQNLETHTPLKLSSAFYLASVSKQFTTMAIMILKEHGKLSYDDTLDKFFPQFPEYAKGVTIRHMMTHTSGIPDHFSIITDTDGLTNQDVLESLIKQDSLLFQPGEKYSYSNGAYVLLSLIVAQVSGQPYHIFMKENIFDPLKMENTLVYDESGPEVSQRTVGYSLFGDKNDYTLFTTGAGGMYTTVEDLYKWDQALYKNQLVKSESLEEAYTPYVLNNDSSTYYGFGWGIIVDDHGKRVQHSGGLAGFSTYLERHLDQKTTIIFLNSRGTSLGWLSSGIRNILYGKDYELPKAPISLKLNKIYKKSGIAKVLIQFDILKEENQDVYVFGEPQINRYGYYLLQNDKIKDAIEIFKLNMKEYPDSPNVYDSLGDGYDADNNLLLAAKNYEIAYQKGMKISDRNITVYKANLDRVKKKLKGKY